MLHSNLQVGTLSLASRLSNFRIYRYLLDQFTTELLKWLLSIEARAGQYLYCTNSDGFKEHITDQTFK